ncbi:hypothetical protein ACE38W_00520 [Chitinophaga sp. Hz27]|uniref:hypothetical protein n=1 Tax=Chitinophaga sp. Hz27 TaxID=3347169 RepID=UPI0035E274F9
MEKQPKANPHEIFATALKNTKFPADNLSGSWCHHAQIALRYASLQSLGISTTDLAMLHKAKPEDLSYMQVAVLNNNLIQRTPVELNISMDKYIELQRYSEMISTEWNRLAEELRNKITQEQARETVLDNIKSAPAEA